MKIAALYIPEGRLPFVFGEDHKDVTINLGGENLYTIKDSQISNVTRNDFYLEDVFNDNVTMLSCLVGANGGGKTTILKWLTSGLCSVVIERPGPVFKLINSIEHFHRIYYTPYLHTDILGAVGNNGKDLSKVALLKQDNHGDSGLLDDFLSSHHSENSKRWIRFNHFYNRQQLPEVKLPSFNQVEMSILHFDINIHDQSKFHDTSYQIRDVLTLLLNKIDEERKDRENVMVEQFGTKNNNWINPLRFEYGLYEAAIGKLTSILEHVGNRYLQEGYVPEDYVNVLSEMNARQGIEWFLSESGVYTRNKKEVYNLIGDFELLNLVDYMKSLISADRFTDNWLNMMVNEEEALKIIELYDAFNESFNNDWFRFDARPMFGFRPIVEASSGEQQFLNLFSTLFYHAQNVRARVDVDLHSFSSLEHIEQDILLLLDEGDNGFHPQWKKVYIQYLRKMIPIIFDGFNIQIIITSHDPLTLSDVPKNNAVFLGKANNKTVIVDSSIKRTFGANLADLLKDSFFMDDEQIGNFVSGVIDQLIAQIKKKDLNEKEISDCERIILAIDEPIIKFKLAEMLAESIGDNKFERQLLEAEIARLQEKRNRL